MAFKFLAFCALVAVARAGVIAQAPVAYAQSFHYAQPTTYIQSQPTTYIKPQQTTYIQPQATTYIKSQPTTYIQSQPATYIQPQHTTYIKSQPAITKTIVSQQPQLIAKSVEEYDTHPQYSFSYDIHDTLTGDAKTQTESRDGDVVKGQYSLIEADGTRRIVDYTADPVHGFNAVVRKEGVAHPDSVVKVAQPVIAKTLVTAPVQKTIISQPAVAYHQPAVAYHSQPAHYAHSDIHYSQPAAVVKTHY